jgi:transketolase
MNKEEVAFLEYYANQLRIHSIEMTTAAGTGHPTSCASAAEIMACLFFRELRFDPSNPKAHDVDEFILSKGHIAPIWYAALAEAGAIDKKELKNLRKFSSVLEGHPMPRFEWTKAATGSLGQGLSISCGIAIAQRLDHSDKRTYCLMGDGEVAEGSVWEAMNLAAKENLKNLVAIIDVNRLGQSRETMHGWNTRTYEDKAESFGWYAITIDGHDIRSICEALDEAKEAGRPTLIVARTIKGKSISGIEDKNGHHGKPLSKSEAKEAIAALQTLTRPTTKPTNFIKAKSKPSNHQLDLPNPKYKLGQKVATRDAFGHAFWKLAELSQDIVAVDGDVGNSTRLAKAKEAMPGRYIQGFIAEQNMVGVAAGLSIKGKLPVTSTFAAFFCRAYDQIRMANYSGAGITLVGSHAGIEIGADGPSQMGLEDLGMFRMLHGTTVLYPADAVAAENLTVLARKQDHITYVRTTRGATPVIYQNSAEFKVGGSHTLIDPKTPHIILAAAGITLHEALYAAHELKKHKINAAVIDLYSVKPLDKKSLTTLAKKCNKILTIEDHAPEGGIGDAVASLLSGKATVHKLAVYGIPRSGKTEELLHHFKIDAKHIVKQVKVILKK